VYLIARRLATGKGEKPVEGVGAVGGEIAAAERGNDEIGAISNGRKRFPAATPD